MYIGMNSKLIRDVNPVALIILLKYQPSINDCDFEILLLIKATQVLWRNVEFQSGARNK